MMEWTKQLVMRWYRIPPDPQPPAGTESSVRVFRAARNYYRFAQARWCLRQLGAVIGILFFLALGRGFVDMTRFESAIPAEEVRQIPQRVLEWGDRIGFLEIYLTADGSKRVRISFASVVTVLETFGVAFFLLQLPLTYAVVRLNYELRWYIVTDRSLRVREGVATIRETTMTFANIQNLSIHQGPIQRMIGIADLRVRTAGGGSSDEGGDSNQQGGRSDSMHIGYFRGVDNAGEIRDLILARVRSLKDSGLGENVRAPAGAPPPQPVAAARLVLDEARALRAVLAGDRG